MLHPPGTLLFLQPFAAIGQAAGDPVGMASARLGFMAMGAASAVLIYLILREQSMTAAVVGAGLYAVWMPAFYVERTVRLEGLATVLILLGIFCLRQLPEGRHPARAAVLAGAMFGLGAVVKVWGVVPVVVLVVWLWLHHGPRRAGQALLAAAGAAGLTMLPFAIASPLWWEMVILDQFGRTPARRPLLARVADIVGLGPVPVTRVVAPLVIALALTVVAFFVASRTPQGRLFAMLAAANTAGLLISQAWYAHYPAFVAAPLCLLYGSATAVVVRRIPRPVLRRISLAVVALGLSLSAGVLMAQQVGDRFPGPQLGRILAARPGCIATDNATALILSDTLRRNLAEGCPVVVDLTGYNHHFSRRHGLSDERIENPMFQEFAIDYLRSGTSTVILRLDEGDLTAESLRTVASWAVAGRASGVRVLAPDAR